MYFVDGKRLARKYLLKVFFNKRKSGELGVAEVRTSLSASYGSLSGGIGKTMTRRATPLCNLSSGSNGCCPAVRGSSRFSLRTLQRSPGPDRLPFVFLTSGLISIKKPLSQQLQSMSKRREWRDAVPSVQRIRRNRPNSRPDICCAFFKFSIFFFH